MYDRRSWAGRSVEEEIMEVQLPLDGIRDRLRKRQAAMRGWVTPEAHPLLNERVRVAHQALGAMVGILEDIAPHLSDLLAQQGTSLDMEQQAREQYAKEAREAARVYREMAEEFREAGEDAEAEIWEAAAKRNEAAGGPVPDLTQWSKSLWNLAALSTATSLFASADYISQSRDIEAMAHMGRKAGSTLGKWLLKLSPIRKEDIDDFVELWNALKKIITPGKDVVTILESSKLRTAQVKVATSLLGRLDLITDVATEWCRHALEHPVLSIALGIDKSSQANVEAILLARLDKVAGGWDTTAP